MLEEWQSETGRTSPRPSVRLPRFLFLLLRLLNFHQFAQLAAQLHHPVEMNNQVQFCRRGEKRVEQFPFIFHDLQPLAGNPEFLDQLSYVSVDTATIGITHGRNPREQTHRRGLANPAAPRR